MNGYAPNPSSSDQNEYAPLTASLLARKGEAMPAVDAQAHAGVDIDMRPVRPANSAGAPRNISQETIESLYPPPPAGDKDQGQNNIHAFHSPSPQAETPRRAAVEQPGAWTAAPSLPRRPRLALNLRPPRSSVADPGGRKATVSFRMPAKDFIRLRFASRDMEMLCQTLILEALDCYLDANDIAQVSDEDCEQEIERLARMLKERRARK